MHITIINDCRDSNAGGRQTIRASSLIGGDASFIGVSSDFEASGNLIDALDAYGEATGVVLVNVAPRDGKAKRWPNGTPFGYFKYKNVLVVSSIDGLTLSLIKKFKLVDSVTVLDIPTVMKQFVKEGILDNETAEHVVDTQFRSYDFLPRVASYLVTKGNIVGENLQIKDIADAPASIWWVDNFGNCKTTMLKEELVIEGDKIKTRIGDLAYFDRLKDVPNHTVALITGSSGIGNHRFIELVSQGSSASKQLSLTSGDLIN